MNSTDREVRARVYELFVAGHRTIDAELIGIEGASEALRRLASENRLVLDGGNVLMAHPFSGVDTGHTATIGDTTYWSNCAWDALAVLSLLGDGVARCPDGPEWHVREGVVSPEGVIHLLVPASRFWDDVVFT